jgi:ABC-type uncharacterized transport system substrate-binding protein
MDAPLKQFLNARGLSKVLRLDRRPTEMSRWIASMGFGTIGRAIVALSVAATVALAVTGTPSAFAGTRDAEYALTPVTKDGGKRWRIGYYEGGQYTDYEIILKAIVRGLIDLGWVEPLKIDPSNNPEAGGFWRYLAANSKSRYIEFVADAYFAPGNFDPTQRAAVKAKALERLNKGDIDLMLAFGTWAGQDLANRQHKVPTIVASTSDPIGSGIVAGATDSGLDHLHAKVEPGRYQRQVELFHDFIGFKKLGVVYEDSREGRTFGGIDAVEEAAKKRGFEIVRCNTPFNGVSRQQAEEGIVRCYDEIAKKADAVYITVHQGVTLNNMQRILAPLIAAKIPTFSMNGTNEVKYGVLMSLSQAGFADVGRFHAETIARIFNGAKPRDLEQRWYAPAKLAINLETARSIGYVPPVDIMLAADQVFESTAKPNAPK